MEWGLVKRYVIDAIHRLPGRLAAAVEECLKVAEQVQITRAVNLDMRLRLAELEARAPLASPSASGRLTEAAGQSRTAPKPAK